MFCWYIKFTFGRVSKSFLLFANMNGMQILCIMCVLGIEISVWFFIWKKEAIELMILYNMMFNMRTAPYITEKLQHKWSLSVNHLWIYFSSLGALSVCGVMKSAFLVNVKILLTFFM